MTGIVHLNVGGTRYSTTLRTLSSAPLISKLNDIDTAFSKDQDGCYFIDRDGEMFKYILNFLRNSTPLVLPEDFKHFKQLTREAQFYQIPKLESAIKAIERDMAK